MVFQCLWAIKSDFLLMPRLRESHTSKWLGVVLHPRSAFHRCKYKFAYVFAFKRYFCSVREGGQGHHKPRNRTSGASWYRRMTSKPCKTAKKTICGLNDSLNYCGFYFEAIYLVFWLVKRQKNVKLKQKNAECGDRLAEA